tara:strand:+ start:1033 stop:2187 length:1155 start_codon:yes stop_codon:yes gene_type:complete
MALFDLNSRYTKSMEHGGSYERDAAVGGYNRKELRGLNKQARRGTLTQRERARLKYLTDERGGRRKRGLLAGLGGVGATLGGLALAGKLGGGDGEGGEGRGAALMDAIKLRLAEGKEKRMRRRADPMEGISSLEAPKNVREEGLMESGPGIGEARRSAGADLVSDSTNRQEDLGHGEMTGLIDEMIERSNEDKQKADENKPARGTDPRDFSGELSESVGEGDLYEAARFSNSPTNINEVTGLRSRSVDLGSDFPAEIPESQSNKRSIEYSNNLPPAVDPNDAITRIFQRTGSRAVRANSVDPMGLLGGDSRDENVSEAQREEDAVEFLSLLNRRRVEKGLPEVNKITMDAIKETGRSTSELMNSRQFGQIPTNRPARQILNRYN